MHWRVERDVVRGFTDAVVKRLLLWAVAFIFLSWLLGGVRDLIPSTYDSTDGDGVRSNMEPLTDHGTCLQYLAGAKGGLTPRLAPDGTHMTAPGCRAGER